MNLSQRLRTCAKHTGLDAVIELLQEAADEIDALQARAQVQGDPSWWMRETDEGAEWTDTAPLVLSGWTPLYTTPQPAQATQAEAQQPATGEPVGFTYQAEIDYANSTGGNGSFWRVPPDLDDEAVPLYTHPAPSVPDDSKRLDYLQDRGATIDLIAGVADFYPMRFRVGGLHSSANIDVRAAIDAAMLAAK